MQITAVATLPWSNDQLAASVHVQATGGPDAGVPTSAVNTGAAATWPHSGAYHRKTRHITG
jgi:hypothetical protein